MTHFLVFRSTFHISQPSFARCFLQTSCFAGAQFRSQDSVFLTFLASERSVNIWPVADVFPHFAAPTKLSLTARLLWSLGQWASCCLNSTISVPTSVFEKNHESWYQLTNCFEVKHHFILSPPCWRRSLVLHPTQQLKSVSVQLFLYVPSETTLWVCFSLVVRFPKKNWPHYNLRVGNNYTALSFIPLFFWFENCCPCLCHIGFLSAVAQIQTRFRIAPTFGIQIRFTYGRCIRLHTSYSIM